MRLLKLMAIGEFRLTKDLIYNIPPCAILSHTWGDDDDEVTFKDLTEGFGNSKVGYRKIQFVPNRPLAMACNISGWTLVVSINRITPSSQRLSSLCSAGIAMQLNFMYIYQMFRRMARI